MKTYDQRLVLSLVLAIAIIFAWHYAFAPYFFPSIVNVAQLPTSKKTIVASSNTEVQKLKDRVDIINEGFKLSQRVAVRNEYVAGSINLVGAQIDDLVLLKYKQTLDKNSPDVVLMSPEKTRDNYFTSLGWRDEANSGIELPGPLTLWTTNKKSIGPKEELILTWVNKQNKKFTLRIYLDEHYLFHIKRKVQDLNTGLPLENLQMYVNISRASRKLSGDSMILHEGVVGVIGDRLKEVTFSSLKKDKVVNYDQQTSWLGFSDKYWLVVGIPMDNSSRVVRGKAAYQSEKADFQVEMIEQFMRSSDRGIGLFIGAKQLDLLEKYSKEYNVPLFDRAVDFGMLYFITKPIFLLLDYIHRLIGNFGLAILALTVLIKTALFPLAYKSFYSMNRMKELQPQMMQIRKRYAEDNIRMQQALVELYKKEKVNPVAGCVPLILQMPVFFALYKVLYVTIEMRQARFFGWIQDLSMPDHTTIFNLFGLIDWQPPGFMMIGILPILMGITMYIQQKLNSTPSDPTQAMIMRVMPVVFTFMFASFPSGLVLYWVWSNVLSILQQILIKKLSFSRITKKV